MRSIEQVNNEIELARSTQTAFDDILKPLIIERSEIIKHNRDKWDDENYAIDIDCPVHLSHKAKLFTYGHKYAGIWECAETGESDSCPHYDVEQETTEDHEGHDGAIYVCSFCKVAVEGDPIADRAEGDN